MVGQGGCFTLSFVIFDIFLTRIWQYPPPSSITIGGRKEILSGFQSENPERTNQELSFKTLDMLPTFIRSISEPQFSWQVVGHASSMILYVDFNYEMSASRWKPWGVISISMLHVWNIYQHLSSHWPKCRETFHTWRVFANVLEDKKTALLLQRHPAPSPPPICAFWQRIYRCSCVNCLGNCERSLEPNPGDCFKIEQRNTRKDIIILSIKHDFKSPKLGAWSLDPENFAPFQAASRHSNWDSWAQRNPNRLGKQTRHCRGRGRCSKRRAMDF